MGAGGVVVVEVIVAFLVGYVLSFWGEKKVGVVGVEVREVIVGFLGGCVLSFWETEDRVKEALVCCS